MLRRIIISSLTFIIMITIKASAAESGASVSVYIESFNGNVLTANVNAAKFGTAIEKAAESANIPIAYNQIGSETSIYSVNGIKNNYFKDGDSWNGYALRNGSIVDDRDYMNVELNDGDVVVLYYGKPDETEIVSEVETYFSGGIINFDVYGENGENGENGETSQKKSIGGVKIYLKSPNGSNKILFTDENGKARSKPDTFGVYEYFISDRKTTSYPKAVSPLTYYYYYGTEDEESATRAEALAFLVGLFGLKDEGGDAKYSDLEETHKYYREIQAAHANNLVAGYGDGTIRPDEKISLLQFAIFLSRASKDISSVPLDNSVLRLPEWSRQSVANILATGALNGLELDWESAVGAQSFITVYNNLKESA